MITDRVKRLIQRVENVFETGSPDEKYDLWVVVPELSFGRGQVSEHGDLKRLLLLYTQNNGVLKDQLIPYISKIGKEPLATDTTFKRILLKAAKEDPIMRKAQDELFDKSYYAPALLFFEHNGFTLPLSLLVIYDSYVHSGGILEVLKQKITESLPASGGDEKKWIISYVDARHQWLQYSIQILVRATSYRTQFLRDQIAADNWNLDRLPIKVRGVEVNAD